MKYKQLHIFKDLICDEDAIQKAIDRIPKFEALMIYIHDAR